MSDLLQIATPVQPRSYDNPNQNNPNRQQNVQQNPTGQVFNLGSQSEIVKINNRSEDQAQQNLKDDGGLNLINTSSGVLKNPSAALESAKAFMSEELLSVVKQSGDSETLGKLTEFASEVMLTPESLPADMVMQQANSTIYGDKLWNVLKNLTQLTGSPTVEEAVVDFAKAAADLSAKDEILRSLSANFKFLSTEAAPGKAVSEELMAASKALSGSDAQMNFNALKPTLLKLLSYTEHSLLLNDDTKNLLPLIVHNMSRYTDSPDALKSSFESLLHISENIELTEAQQEKLGLQIDESKGETLASKLMDMFDKFITKNENIDPEIKLKALFNPETAKHETELSESVDLLAAGAKHMAARIPAGTMSSVVSTVDFTEGAPALQKVLSAVIPNTENMRAALNSLFDELEQTHDLDAMITRLNKILENIDDSNADSSSRENMITLAQGLNTALGEMAASGQYTLTTPTSMETLTDFLTKNIDNSILHSLSGMNQGDMVQNMLTAPGVFNPLIHQFVPLDAFGLKAFGEMWIDPNDDELMDNVRNNRKNGKGEAGNHMFLCFDIEDTGYFELEVYEKDKNLSILLLCPEDTEKDFSSVRDVIPKIASENGYRVTSSLVEPLRAKRSLDQVFPKLTEQRSSLNVKI